MLAQLKGLHGELRGAIAVLAELLSRAEPDEVALPAARLRIARLSRQQRSLIECTILPLLHDASPSDARAISELSLSIAAQSIKYSEHIGRWTRNAVLTDWAGYRRASVDLSQELLRMAEREAVVLYPLLQAKLYQAAAA